MWELEGTSRAVTRVYLLAASRMLVRCEITLLCDAILVFGIAMSGQGWQAEGDGVTFKVRVQDDIRVEGVLPTHLNARGDLSDTGWPEFEVELEKYGNKRVGIISIREPGPQGNGHCHEARSAGRRLLSGAMVPTETAASAATATYTSTHIQLLSSTSSPFSAVTLGREGVWPTATSDLLSERRVRIVQLGENVWMIPQKCGGTVEAIMHVNDLDDHGIIGTGQELIIFCAEDVFPHSQRHQW